VLDYLAEFITTKGYSPSFEEIAGALNLASLATVHKHISALEAKNYVRRSYNQSRSLEITSRGYEETNRTNATAVREVPLLGRIAAGAPVEAVQGSETLNFGDFVRDENTYALQVRGESMIEDHICSGDYVLVERAPNVRDGDIVVALVEGSEATLKRFYRESDGTIRLQPANSSMQPIRVSPSNLEIQGRVLAVLRKFQ
jgi:repressor LexA